MRKSLFQVQGPSFMIQPPTDNAQAKLQELSKLLAINQWDQAIPIARQLVQAFPQVAVTHFLLGFALSGRNFFVEACEQYRAALVIEPNHAGAVANLGAALFDLGHFAEAAEILKRGADLDPENLRAKAMLALAERAMARPYQNTLTSLLEHPSRDHNDTAIKMWAALQLNRPEQAFSLRVPGLNSLDYAALGQFYRQPNLQARLGALGELKGTLPNKSARALIYAGGDGVYAQRFAKQLIASALTACPQSDIHFHVMNPGSYNPENDLAEFPRDRVTWSVEHMGPVNKIMFSARRWLRLAQIQWRVERTIVLIDTDSIVRGDIIAALPTTFDVVLYDRPNEFFVYQMVNGGFYAVAPSGRDFTDFVAAHILHFEEAGKAKWFDDQFAVIVAREWFKRNISALTIVGAPPNMMDLAGAKSPESLIWHYKGTLKDDGAD